MMSETEAQQTSSKDNTSWVSCLKLLMLEQIVDLKMSTLGKSVFSAVCAGSCITMQWKQQSEKANKSFTVMDFCLQWATSLCQLISMVHWNEGTHGFLKSNQSKHSWLKKDVLFVFQHQFKERLVHGSRWMFALFQGHGSRRSNKTWSREQIKLSLSSSYVCSWSQSPHYGCIYPDLPIWSFSWLPKP